MEIRIAMLYTVWTGDYMSMLHRSIKHHEKEVDGVFVFYQNMSNRGVYEISGDYKMQKLSHNTDAWFAEFVPDENKNTKENERTKHNRMIQSAKAQGYTHFIMLACDHFYDKSTFENAKKLHLKKDLDVTFTRMITYYKNDNWAVYPLEDYYMPFIHKMHPDTCISRNANYPVLVDPSVKVNTFEKYHVMDEKEGILDHYSMVRPDIQKKFRNAAASIRWKPEQVETFISEYENAKLGDKITYFQGRELVEVDDLKKNAFPIKKWGKQIE